MKRLIVFAFLVVALVGCKGSFSERSANSSSNSPGSTGKVFRYSIVTNPTKLDPGMVQDGDTIDMVQQVFEGLVNWGEDNHVKPLLAEKWEVENDGKTYVFTIKKGAKFHSGREVTAEDFKWSMERNASPALASPTVQYLGDIVGVNDYVAGKADSISGIEVRDKYTLAITIDKPRPYFLGKLTYLISAVMDKDKVPADKEITSVDQMVGTGPFKMSRFEPNQLVVQEAFADYHGGKPKVDRIERIVLKDAATRLNKYKAGEIDLVQLERQDINTLKKDPEFASQLKFYDRPAIWYIGMNQDAFPPFKDRRVRRAFAMAIDKDKIVDQLLEGINTVANGIVPPGVLGHRENTNSLTYNPTEAKKLLADAGYPDGKGFPELEMTFREGRPDIKTVAEAAAIQLKANLGINVNLRTMEWGAYLDRWNKKEMPFFHMRWAADYLDPENFLSFMLSTTGPENKIGYSNPEFDRLCAEGDITMDEATRLPLYGQAEDIALQDAPWIPIYFQRDAELIRPYVKGLRESLFGHLPHTTVTIEK